MEIHFVLSTIPKFRLCFRKIFNDFVDLTHIWLSTYCERAFERTYQYVEQILVWIRQSPPLLLHQLPIRNCLFAIRLIDLNDWMNLLQKPDEIFSWKFFWHVKFVENIQVYLFSKNSVPNGQSKWIRKSILQSVSQSLAQKCTNQNHPSPTTFRIIPLE